MPGKIKLCWLHIALFLGYNGGSIGTKCVIQGPLGVMRICMTLGYCHIITF